MKYLLKPIAIAAVGFCSVAMITSCSKEARQEAAAERAAESAVDVTEDYCELLESIKDKESAQKAIADMDKLGDKYAKIAENAKKAGSTPPDAAAITKMQEDMKPLQDRMIKASTTAMPIISSDPELMKAFQEKSMSIATKMQAAAQ